MASGWCCLQAKPGASGPCCAMFTQPMVCLADGLPSRQLAQPAVCLAGSPPSRQPTQLIVCLAGGPPSRWPTQLMVYPADSLPSRRLGQLVVSGVLRMLDMPQTRTCYNFDITTLTHATLKFVKIDFRARQQCQKEINHTDTYTIPSSRNLFFCLPLMSKSSYEKFDAPPNPF